MTLLLAAVGATVMNQTQIIPNANLGNDFALDASALLDDLFKGM